MHRTLPLGPAVAHGPGGHLTKLGMVVAYRGAVLPPFWAKEAVSCFPGHLIGEAQLLACARHVLVPEA